MKRRGGILLDIKLRTGAGGDLAIGDVAGRVELWVKWTFPLGDGLPRSMGEGWTAVTKYRHSRRYELAADGTARSVSGTGIVVDGCAAELVELKVGRNRAWGFGFEAFGSRREPFTVLHAAAEAFLRESPLDGLRFDPVDARGYPGWLQEWPDGRPH